MIKVDYLSFITHWQKLSPKENKILMIKLFPVMTRWYAY